MVITIKKSKEQRSSMMKASSRGSFTVKRSTIISDFWELKITANIKAT